METINRLEDLKRVVAELDRLPEQAQKKRLDLIRQRLELAEMYYEQSNNAGGLARMRQCLAYLGAKTVGEE